MTKKPESKPVGDALDWTDEEIDRLAQITPEDIASAKATAKRLMPKGAAKVLDAEKDDESRG